MSTEANDSKAETKKLNENDKAAARCSAMDLIVEWIACPLVARAVQHETIFVDGKDDDASKDLLQKLLDNITKINEADNSEATLTKIRKHISRWFKLLNAWGQFCVALKDLSKDDGEEGFDLAKDLKSALSTKLAVYPVDHKWYIPLAQGQSEPPAASSSSPSSSSSSSSTVSESSIEKLLKEDDNQSELDLLCKLKDSEVVKLGLKLGERRAMKLLKLLGPIFLAAYDHPQETMECLLSWKKNAIYNKETQFWTTRPSEVAQQVALLARILGHYAVAISSPGTDSKFAYAQWISSVLS